MQVGAGDRFAARRCRAAVLVAVAVLAGTAARAGDRGSNLLVEAFDRWEARPSEIATAVIAYRSFHNSVDGGTTLAEFNALLDEGTLDHTPDGLRRFITKLNGGPFRVDPPWGSGRMTRRDAQQRNDLGPFVTLEDRENSVYFDSLNNQLDVAWLGGSRHRADTLDTFRPLPPQPWSPDRWQAVETAGELTLRRILAPERTPPELDARVWSVDPATGLVTRIVRHNARGEVLSIARYLDIVELPGAIAFPRLAVEATLRDGIVTTLHACVIDSIRVNEPIPDEAFHLPAPANSKVVDQRGARRIVVRLDQPQPDVMAWLKQHIPAPPVSAARPSGADHTMRNMLLTGNGLLLLAVGIILWKRARPGAADHPKSTPSTPKDS